MFDQLHSCLNYNIHGWIQEFFRGWSQRILSKKQISWEEIHMYIEQRNKINLLVNRAISTIEHYGVQLPKPLPLDPQLTLGNWILIVSDKSSHLKQLKQAAGCKGTCWWYQGRGSELQRCILQGIWNTSCLHPS